ncbi:MAG TPA: metalloregulator ArsR/SmtB family transcription factor [Thermoleophilaceae bacterium]|nr:metalloregulator ArsR/SmtB family transcription factor [Thermoleophilaceae bacterium]
MPTYRNGFDALGDPTRRAIFERLARGPTAVGELAQELPVSRPAVSQHLRVLKRAGLVSDQREGSRRLYEVDLDGVEALRTYLDSFWTDALAAFRNAAERKGAT